MICLSASLLFARVQLTIERIHIACVAHHTSELSTPRLMSMDSGYAHRESTTFRTCIWAIRRFHVSLCAVFIGSVRKFDHDTRISLSSSFFLLHSFFFSLIELFSRSMWQLLIAVIYTHAYLIFAWLSLRNAKLTRSTALARSLWLACIIVSSYFHHTYVTSLSLSLSLSLFPSTHNSFNCFLPPPV